MPCRPCEDTVGLRRTLHINPVPCTACMNCIRACSHHKTGGSGDRHSALQLVMDPFSGMHRFNWCRQCVKALCAEVCPEKAITWSDLSEAWVLNRDLCSRCGHCIDACPFNAIPRLDGANGYPLKCDHCGGDPECVKACHFGVLSFEYHVEPVRRGIPSEDLDPDLGKTRP